MIQRRAVRLGAERKRKKPFLGGRKGPGPGNEASSEEMSTRAYMHKG